ncbi:hypothetical protein EVAR_78798_1 [Eumeta japonica]|uniref:Uncharacterized protein n=1 Tax=Eumeta variegata TaxID=151549 RepID=A0A4C1T2E8_EUMVA|nr:hypothetical protein EVAR_78798_1 [Eumeta japonica]
MSRTALILTSVAAVDGRQTTLEVVKPVINSGKGWNFIMKGQPNGGTDSRVGIGLHTTACRRQQSLATADPRRVGVKKNYYERVCLRSGTVER